MKHIIPFLALAIITCVQSQSARTAEIHHAQGEFAGEVTSTSVLLQSRLTSISGPALDKSGDVPGAEGVACFELSESPDFTNSRRTDWLIATSDHDFIVRTKIDGLQPGKLYFYRLIYGQDKVEVASGATRQFKTRPIENSNRPLSFCMGSCQNYAFFLHGKAGKGSDASRTDKHLGYPAYTAMLSLQPDFFIGTGDIVYYDHPASTAAKTLPELRKKWHEQFRFPRMIEFFGRTPAYWSKDDHDFRFNDADLGGNTLPLPKTGIDIFREQMPIHSAGDHSSPTYRTHRVHRHVQLWFVEGRDFRSPNKMEDGQDKTIWGKEQRDWLQRTLLESDATWKIIITPTPMVGPDSKNKKDNHVNLKGFRHEANSFFEWTNKNKQQNVITFCGDRHWQYHSIHPLGMHEFSCGALNDENAIAGTRPGSKNGTDPDGLIKQPFIYPAPTGGFLHVTVGQNDRSEATLQIEFRDDTGRVLHTVSMPEKTALKP